VKTVAIYGALGAVVQRLLTKGFVEARPLLPQVHFVAVDTLDPNTQWEEIAKRMAKLAFPWNPQLPYASVEQITLNADNSFFLGDKRVVVDGVVVATPTSTHLHIVEQWATRGALVWVDKPITLIPEAPHIRQLAAQHPNIFAVDFFLDSDAMLWFLAQMRELLGRIGPPTALHGRLIESWPIEMELGQRWWLLMPEISGGGAGMDAGVHPLAMFSPILDVLALKLGDVEITDVVMGGTDPSRTVETAFWCKGRVGGIELLVDCGKGLEDTCYGITVVGEKGSVEICVGTEEVDPYLRVVDSTGTEVRRFENGQIGYGHTWLDYLTLLHGGQVSSLSLQQRLDACVGSVEVVGKAYALHTSLGSQLVHHEVGQPLPVPQKVLGAIAPEVPRSKVRTWAT